MGQLASELSDPDADFDYGVSKCEEEEEGNHRA